ncbi:MAG TPA: hypothetical protein VGN20_14740 [Mucilaginibacter sp.]|jgi:hypothetical protein
MKKAIYFLSAALLVSLNVSAQHAIRANRVSNHVGEKVVVVDSIYDIKIYNDTTAVLDLGGPAAKAPLNVVFNFKSKQNFNPDLFQSLKESLIEVTGDVVLIAQQPAIVVTNKDNLYFFSNSVNQNWQVLSQVLIKRTESSFKLQ